MRDRISSLKNELGDMRGRQAALQRELESTEKSIGRTAAGMQQLEQEKGDLIDEVLELEERLTREESLRAKAEQKLATARSELLSAVASMMDRRDPQTTLHHRRVAQLGNVIGSRMRLNEETIRTLIMAASVHDIGKFAWPDVVLREKKKADKSM